MKQTVSASFFLITLLIGMLTTSLSHAVVEQLTFKDQQTEERYKNLIAELRCLVCQNQSLADSDADLAKDLRRKTAEMLQSGATDKDILEYMRDRYGDFVLYRPPFNTTTALLWLGPVVLLFCVFIGLYLNIKRRQEDELLHPTQAKDEAERVKIRNLLRNTSELTESGDHQPGHQHKPHSNSDQY